MIPRWSVQNQILKRIQVEDNERWGKSPDPKLPPQEKVKKEKLTVVGCFVLLKESILEFRP